MNYLYIFIIITNPTQNQFEIIMEQLYFIRVEHDESETRQVVFHFMDNEILYTLYDVVMNDHQDDMLSTLLEENECRFDEVNNIIHLRWFSKHNVSSSDLKFFITKNKSYISMSIYDGKIIKRYIPYDFLKFMNVKVENMIDDYEYEYIAEVKLNEHNLIEGIESPYINSVCRDVNYYRLKEYYNMYNKINKFIIKYSENSIFGRHCIHIDKFREHYSKFIQWINFE